MPAGADARRCVCSCGCLPEPQKEISEQQWRLALDLQQREPAEQIRASIGHLVMFTERKGFSLPLCAVNHPTWK